MQHGRELAGIVELDQTAHGPVIAASYELTTNPNGGDAGSADQICHFGPNGLAIGIRVEFHYRVLGTECVQDLLGLDAKGSTETNDAQKK